jgi:hypothetical protein
VAAASEPPPAPVAAYVTGEVEGGGWLAAVAAVAAVAFIRTLFLPRYSFPRLPQLPTRLVTAARQSPKTL